MLKIRKYQILILFSKQVLNKLQIPYDFFNHKNNNIFFSRKYIQSIINLHVISNLIKMFEMKCNLKEK